MRAFQGVVQQYDLRLSYRVYCDRRMFNDKNSGDGVEIVRQPLKKVTIQHVLLTVRDGFTDLSATLLSFRTGQIREDRSSFGRSRTRRSRGPWGDIAASSLRVEGHGRRSSSGQQAHP